MKAAERARLAGVAGLHVGTQPDRIVLETCHRVELYGFGPVPELGEGLQFTTGPAAIRHLMRVASGLDSAIIGEDEVLHQVRSALSTALASRALDRRLQRLFQLAISAGRRARAGRTATGANLAQRAVGWLQQSSPLSGQPVLIAGAGRMGSALAHSARQRGADVIIASRDAARARRLAQVYDGRGLDLAGAAGLVQDCAGVAVALAGEWHHLQAVNGHLPPIADISAPPAIPARIRARLNGNYLGIDDLYVQSGPIPSAFMAEAERVVQAKTEEYLGWLNGRR